MMKKKRRITPAHVVPAMILPAGLPGPGDGPITWGYTRVSTDDQTTARQLDALAAGGVDGVRIVQEELSGGVPALRRPALAGLLSVLRPGDALAVQSVDRLGRDPADVLALARDLAGRGVRLRILALAVETGTPTGDLVLGLLASVAGWERAIIRERTREGLAAAKRRGQLLGRRRVLSPAQREHARLMAAEGASLGSIARVLGCGRTVVHRAIREPADG